MMLSRGNNSVMLLNGGATALICATFWAVNLASLHHLTEQNKPAQHGCSRQLYVSTVGFTKFRVTVATSLCTTAQHISSKIKAFLHHLC